MEVPVTLELLADLSNKGYTVLYGKDNILTPVKWDWDDLMNNDEYKRFEDDTVLVISELMEFWDPEDVGEFKVDVP
ncbi:hypothetical protein FKG96_12510 [Olivibacter sp. LS-1]|uniref:hypothetical protein n=1 Tax=Olivibacter sp. LS-1 TaxID=2592345 RepID=UPI0011EAE404|nr:hypothetical protein [Olivibacter sp. LS-1]QEL01594.1 hypothetical protein FKG96_12510 [Olivibacter sp. LS-1]